MVKNRPELLFADRKPRFFVDFLYRYFHGCFRIIYHTGRMLIGNGSFGNAPLLHQHQVFFTGLAVNKTDQNGHYFTLQEADRGNFMTLRCFGIQHEKRKQNLPLMISPGIDLFCLNDLQAVPDEMTFP
ncbi:hypothetical protein D9M68_792030 [compost metagenome]